MAPGRGGNEAPARPRRLALIANRPVRPGRNNTDHEPEVGWKNGLASIPWITTALRASR
jgi:hypothetical protein